jgi:arylformamidase
MSPAFPPDPRERWAALVHDAINLHAKRSASGAPGLLLQIDGADHFSIISELQRPDGALVRAAIDLLSRS